MVFGKIFGGIYSIDPDQYDFHMQGQGFSKEEARRLDFIVKRRNFGTWSIIFGAALAIPLSSRFRRIAINKYSLMSNKLLSPYNFNLILCGGTPFMLFLTQ